VEKLLRKIVCYVEYSLEISSSNANEKMFLK
jgi:hypothetical protein